LSVGRLCLQLDVGNSSAKWRLVDAGRVLKRGRYVAGDAGSREALLDCAETVGRILVASVAAEEAERELSELLRDRWGVHPWFARTPSHTGDLVNSYTEPGRMGVDRWLAMLAARRRFAGRLCVVDAGSALTIDLVAASGTHEGGYIIPGPVLMERALLLDTDRVRFEEAADYTLQPGASTADAVRHGIALAQAGAVALVLERTAGEPPVLVFCGGGAQTLMGLLGRGGEWLPDLVFEGLEVMAQVDNCEQRPDLLV
jgi:type III pantothenate kinase